MPGDTLIIRGGRYILQRYDDDIIIPSTGRKDAWISIRGEYGNRPILAGRDNLSHAIDLSGTKYIRIENLEIIHDNQANGSGVYFRDGIVIIGRPANFIILNKLYIHHIDEFGLNFQDVNNLKVNNCRIEYAGFGAIGGSTANYGGWRNVHIWKCRLSYSGHYYRGGDGNPQPTPWSAIVIGTEVTNARFEIVNVTIDDTLGRNYIMYVQYDTPNVPVNSVIRNSIFRGAGPSSAIFVGKTSKLTATYNIFYLPKTNYVLEHGNIYYTSANIGKLGNGNTYGDPLFVNPAWSISGDYHLQMGSPAIDMGTSTYAPLIDVEGTPRPQGKGFDKGSYER